jgi:hypothetical protein
MLCPSLSQVAVVVVFHPLLMCALSAMSQWIKAAANVTATAIV